MFTTMAQSEMTFNIGLLAIAAGGLLIYLSKKENLSCTSKLGKLVVILGFLSIACTTFWTVRYYLAGVYNQPIKHAQMMDGGMMNCPMMDGMMKGGMPMNEKGMAAPNAPTNPKPEDHNAHH